MTTRYRPYQHHDADGVKEVLRRDLGADHIAPQLLDSVLDEVLHSQLQASTYAQVAIQDGELVGVIMGRVTGQHRLPGRLGHRIAAWRQSARLAVRGVTELPSGAEHRTLDRLGLRQDPADPITLFAVDSPTRGRVIGRALYDGYLNHLRSHGRCDCDERAPNDLAVAPRVEAAAAAA